MFEHIPSCGSRANISLSVRGGSTACFHHIFSPAYNMKGQITVPIYLHERNCTEMPDIYIIAGGDMRFAALAEQLAEDNRVFATGFDKSAFSSDKVTVIDNIGLMPCKGDHLILPLPVSNDGITLNTPFYKETIPLSGLTGLVKDGGTVFGGRVSPEVREIFRESGIEIIDYFEREELSVLNALATAEGALQIALEEQPTIISGEKILILGMGRIAKTLIRILSGFGADITVAARKYSDLAWAEVFGCGSCHIGSLKDSPALSGAGLIFNTVPELILDETALEHCSKSALIIDLASKPGGMDFEAAGRLGLRAVWALSLPGKTAPVSSGRIIGKAIENILKERSEK